MAASTITRDTWTNDTGTAANPNGDGTVLNNTVLQNNIYARVDAMFAGAGAYTTFTLGGKFAAEGFGSHTLSAGGTGSNMLVVRNTTAGTGNDARIRIGNDANIALLELVSLASTYSSSSYAQANGSFIYEAGAGGLSIVAGDGAGVIRCYSGGSTERMRIDAAGCVLVGAVSSLSSVSSAINSSGGYYVGRTGAADYAFLNSTYVTFLSSASATYTTLDKTSLLATTWPTTASAANAWVGDNDYLKRSTSIRANKHAIRPIRLEDARQTVLGLEAVLYQSRVDEDQRNWAGFIAEDVEQVNQILATYGPQGDLQSVTYDRVPVYLLPVVQDHEARLRALEAKL